MKKSTSEIVSGVFKEYTPQVVGLSSYPRDTERLLNDMCSKLNNTLSDHHYNNVFQFVSSVDIDDVISSSPPKSKMIVTDISLNLKTPEKKSKYKD